MSWMPKPMELVDVDIKYVQRSSGRAFEGASGKLHPVAYGAIREAQEDLWRAAVGWPLNTPIMVFNSVTRTVDFQDSLAAQNKMRKSDMYPNGIPTASAGSSLHNFGLAVDLDTRETMRRINDAKIDLSFQDFRQFLAGYYIMGIQSEAWHFNLMLEDEWASKEGWELRDHLYKENWAGLDDEQKVTLLQLGGATGDTLQELALSLQGMLSNTLEQDGVAGPKTLRAAYCRWALK